MRIGSRPVIRFRSGKHRNRSTISSTCQLRLESLEPRHVLATSVVISEFQASNDSTLTDEDGDTPDWIELQNTSLETVNLEGMFLTDDATDLMKWRFPAATIGPNEFLVVFASNKDRIDPASELHTNFALSSRGEFLALVEADGVTFNDNFSPEYPAQSSDQSYGLAVGRASASLIDPGVPATALVPTDDSLGTSWTETDFDDGDWKSGTTAVGFEQLATGFSTRDDFSGDLGPEWTVDIPEGGTSTYVLEGGKLKVTVPGEQETGEGRGLAPLFLQERPMLNSDYEIITHVSLESGSGDAGIAIVDGITGLPVLRFEYRRVSGFISQLQTLVGDEVVDSKVQLSRTEAFLRVVRQPFRDSWTTYFKQNADDPWEELHVATEGVSGVPQISNPKIGLVASNSSGAALPVDFDFFELIVADEQPVYDLKTGLDIEAEMFNVASSAYVRVPFTVAGDPLRFDEMDLIINYDDGFIAYLNGTEVTRRNVPIESAWDSNASGSHGAVDGRIPTDVISLNDQIGLLKSGDNVLALQGMNVAADDKDFFLQPQLTTAEVLTASPQVFVAPTPGAANNLPAAPKPTFSETGGTFIGSKTVEILNPEPAPNFQIRYTIDGAEPDEESLLYTAPLVLTKSTWLRAKVFDNSSKQAFSPSNTTSEAFIALHSDLATRDSDVPLLVIDTLGQSFPGSGASNLASSLVTLYDVDPVTRRASLVDGNLEYSGFGGFRQRGSSTGGQAKPSLTFETWGAFDDDFDVSLLGMPADSDWVLYAPYNFDRTLIHEQFVYGLARDMGRYAPRTQVVEVYANRGGDVLDESDYIGTYVLEEKIKKGEDRVDVATADPDATYTDLASTPVDDPITGGYIWKIDRPDPGELTFNAGGQGLNWVYPKHPNSTSNALKVTPAQQAYVQDFFDEFRSVLDGPDYADPVNGYAKYIDVDSWIDFHLINTLTENVDALALSTYLHKDAGGKVAFGPAWDFDRALESIDNRDDNPLDWPAGGNNLFERTWWRRLFSDPNFFQKYIDRYQGLRQTEFSNEAIDARIDKWAAVVNESRVRDLARWNQTPRSACPAPAEFCDGTWEGEVEHMRDWLYRRLAFMDGQFAPPVDFTLDGDALAADPVGYSVEAGAAVGLSSPGEGLIYYTTDGTDPRGPDGQPTPSAISHSDFGDVLTGDESGKFLVPSGAASEAGWQEVEFDDSTWTTVNNRVGFDEDAFGATLLGEPGFLVHTIDVSTPLLPKIDAATAVLEGGAASVQSDEQRVDPYINHETGSGQFDSPPNLRPPGISGLAAQFATRASAAVTIPVGTWTIAVTSDDGLRLTIPGLEYSNVVGDSRGGVLGPRSDELIAAAIGTKVTYGTFTISDAPFETTLQLDHFNFFASSYVELSIAPGMVTEFDSAAFTILQDGTMGWGVQAAEVTLNKVDYSVQIDSDVSDSMLNQNSSAYLRYPFSLGRSSDVLDLKMVAAYDDGFVAYLNGREVLRVAGPENVTFDAAATEVRDHYSALTPVDFSLNDHLDILGDGVNVLAIQVLNAAVDDTDLLMDVNLSAKVVGKPIVITENTQITARNFDVADRGPQAGFITTDWSGAVTHRFVVDSPQLAITEIHYNPIDLDPSDAFGPGAYEFIEVQNVSPTATADLTGVRLTNGVEFDFTTSDIMTLAPGARVLIVENATAFEQRYGAGLPIAGEFSGGLANAGELVELTGGDGSQLFSVSYGDNDPWPAFADGSGASLELMDPAGVTSSNQGKYYRWQASRDLHGSPGNPNSTPIGVVINEVLSRTDDADGPSDAVELHNPTDAAVDVSGWFLSDDADSLWKFEIPDGTSISAGGYLVFDEGDFNVVGAENGFAFDGAEGDDVFLVIPNAAGDGVESFVDAVRFGSASDLESFGRVPNATGRLAPLVTNSLGSENGAPRFGPLLITELNYNPGPPSAEALAADPTIESRDLEFIEIYNPTNSTTELDNWQIRGGVDYDFDVGEQVGAGETLVIIPFNPTNPDNAARLLAFRAHYGMDDSVRVIGGYQGNLNNASDRIQLQRPDTPPEDQPGLIPGLYEDEVLYDDVAPWPAADGTGDSIQRTGSLGFGNFADSWIAQTPTPGRVELATMPGDLNGDATLDANDIDFLCNSIAGPYHPTFDIDANGNLELADVEEYVSRFLNTVIGDANLDGQINAFDLNAVGRHWLQAVDATWTTGDFTCDGAVDALDLNKVGQSWQFGVAQAVRLPRAPLSIIGVHEFALGADRMIDELATDVTTEFSGAQREANLQTESRRSRQRRGFADRRSTGEQGSLERFDINELLIDRLLADF